MFGLGAALLALPLHLTRAAGLSTVEVGLMVFPLPLGMALTAPSAHHAMRCIGPRWTLRAGLLTVTMAELALAALLGMADGAGPRLVAALLLFGVGIAMVRSTAAVGATRSPAGRYGAGIGLFNLIRFAGATAGASWVSIAWGQGEAMLFGICAVIVALGFIAAFAGPDLPQPAPDAWRERQARSGP